MFLKYAHSGDLTIDVTGLSTLTMPVKNVRMSGHISDMESSFKKDRCSLKRFLDRSRFSPKLLRFTRPSKSVECDNSKFGTNNADFVAAPYDTGQTTDHLFSARSRELSVPSTASSVPTTTPPLHRSSNCIPTKGDIIDENQTHDPVVEEEYEESLSHFADVIIENLRTGHNFIPNSIPDGISELSNGRGSACSTLPTTRIATWSSPGRPPNSEPTEAAYIDSPQLIPSTSSERIHPSTIYNEPCDAKPLLDGVVDGPQMIYTMSSLVQEINEISSNLECSGRKCIRSSPYSGSSDNTGHDTQSLHLSVLEDRTRSVSTTSIHLASSCDSPKFTYGVSRPSRANNGALSASSHPASVDLQPCHGFVDSPRGNSVIVHHPTSPFARVPRAPGDALLSRGNIPDSPTALGGVSASSLASEDIHHPLDVDSNIAGDSPNVTSGSPLKNNSGSIHSPSKQLCKTSQPRSDTQATYEEAWDLKMARQLGFGIPRLTAIPHTLAKNKVSSEQTPTLLQADVMLRQFAPHITPDIAQPTARQDTLEKNDASRGGCSHSSCISAFHHAGGMAKGVLLSHENKLFDERPLQKRAAGSNQPQLSRSASSEYDYAYNGSWCMGVKLNLSLAMNGTSRSEPTPPFSGAVHSVVEHFRLAPPVIPAHHHELPHTGWKSHLTSQKTLSSPLEFDTVSTGSCDDSWDKKHGQVMSELTNSRFMNPTPVLSVPESPSDHSNSSCIQRLGVHIEQVGTGTVLSVVPEAKCSSRTSVLPSRLEVLPLEEQLWYHPSLSRSEAEMLLSCEPEGSFLVRNSETCINDYSLTIKHKTFLHMKISRNKFGQFILGEYSQPYTSVPQMIYHYSRTLVPVRGADCVTLTHPVCRRVV